MNGFLAGALRAQSERRRWYPANVSGDITYERPSTSTQSGGLNQLKTVPLTDKACLQGRRLRNSFPLLQKQQSGTLSAVRRKATKHY